MWTFGIVSVSPFDNEVIVCCGDGTPTKGGKSVVTFGRLKRIKYLFHIILNSEKVSLADGQLANLVQRHPLVFVAKEF